MSSQNYTHFTDKELDIEKKNPYINLEQYEFMVLKPPALLSSPFLLSLLINSAKQLICKLMQDFFTNQLFFHS